ncbi:MAG: carbamoyltransferase HypF, partial [Proteobacteria bacterium]|nr:carbamoyltransferase HypF [Pseudomonadota bacterium]
MNVRNRITIQGIVQGVGFRPFVCVQAKNRNITGYVNNTSLGVEMEIEGTPGALEDFLQAVRINPPPAAHVTDIKIYPIPLSFDNKFSIRQSTITGEKSALISPDIAICNDCLQELNDPSDRRFAYPFINCTNCGPRYTIVNDIPYDRHNTSMTSFKMCEACYEEYHNPLSRRFHAQPNACPVCGPQVLLYDSKGHPVEGISPVNEAAQLLKKGLIVAIKGLGGFHLAVDAVSEEAVKRLRDLKHRQDKPLALMSPDLSALASYAWVNDAQKKVLLSNENPIVLLAKKKPNNIALSVAPGNRYFGVMLPYTPLHHLLFDFGFEALVMTSGNLSNEPICTDNKEAFERLSGIADYFLIHNRDISIRNDDSIVTQVSDYTRQIRRSRGFVPMPVFLKESLSPILACGGLLKNTVCLIKENRAFISQHIGNLVNPETLNYFESTITHLKQILQIEPQIIAYDLHPDYPSTRYALKQTQLRLIGVQHHFAHMVGCMAEHGLNEKVIGIVLDGSGYGLDGRIWGGEVFVGDLSSFERKSHFDYLPMPGGAMAIKEPWRMAVSYLYQAYGEGLFEQSLPLLKKHDTKQIEILLKMIRQKINSPLTSSCGRLFDGVAALTGLRDVINFEGQAAMDLEMVQSREEMSSYPCEIFNENGICLIKHQPIIKGVVEDIKKGKTAAQISRRFHITLIEILTRICCEVREESALEKVVLSGGVFQNRTILSGLEEGLKQKGFMVYSNIL